MKRAFWKSATALIVLAAASVGIVAGDVQRPDVALDDWLEVLSPNVRLITDLDAPRASDLAQVLEALRTSVTVEVLGRPTARQLPATIVVFAEERSYAPFRVAGREGQFYSTAFESLIVVNGGAKGRPLQMAASHEYTHALLSEMEIRLPLWLHEGLAEYYSTFGVSDDVVTVGRSVPGHRARLRNRAFVPFDELVAVDGRSSGYHGEQGARFYAQSWLTVHYLLSDAGRGLGLADLIRTGRDGRSLSGDALSLSGLSSSALDRELRLYLNRESVPVTLFPTAGADTVATAVRPLSESEAAYQLGIVALEQARWDPGREASARELLEAALALDPTRGDAHAGLASLEAMAGHSERAAEAFEHAVFLDALEGRSYAYYAEHLESLAGEEGESEASATRRAREMLTRALDLEPRHRRIALRLEALASEGVGGSVPVVTPPPVPPN